MAQEIVFYHSAMAGAPSGTLNAVGAAIAVLDACLVNGFNSISVSTLTQASGTATATTASSHNFSIGDWVEVAGANEAGYNGRVKVLTKPASNQITFAVAGGTASPATGTITAKHPAAGWSKSSGGTNIAAYQAGSGSLGLWMQVEDNNPYADSNVGMRTRQCQGWTALDTATVLGPQVNTHKATGGWMVIADKKTVYAFFGTLGGTVKSFVFGEFAPFYSADAFCAFHSGGRTLSASNTTGDEVGNNVGADWPGNNFPAVRLSSGDPASAGYNLRGISQIGASVQAGPLMMPGTNQQAASSSFINVYAAQSLFTPSLADNGIPIGPIFNFENASSQYTLRGRFRGMYWPMGKLSLGFANGFQRLDNALVDGVSQSVALVQFAFSGGRQLVFQVDGAWS